METGQFIREQREKADLSLQAMADSLERYGYKVERQTISHWEHGRNGAPIHDPLFRRALAATFNMDVNELLNSIGFILTDEDHSPEARVAADIVDRLPARERKRALIILEAFETSLDINGDELAGV